MHSRRACATFEAVGFNIPVAEFEKKPDIDSLGPDLLSDSFDSTEALRRIRERGSAEILRIQVALLQHRPHRPVKHEDSLRQQLAQGFSGLVQVAHLFKNYHSLPSRRPKWSKYLRNLTFPATLYFTQVSRQIPTSAH